MKKFDVTIKYERTFNDKEFSSLEVAKKYYRDTYGDYASIDIVEKEPKYLVGSIFRRVGICNYMLVGTAYTKSGKKGNIPVGFIVYNETSTSDGLAVNTLQEPVYIDGMTLQEVQYCLGGIVQVVKGIT